ncbi:Rieske (2Fe-2S) protein [Patulibacter defluvii]|uniref:Rieske (2Fe-2S) protein n=1 Tax=Patulibacter defluvii TaxID=3095358 RepID=UPI002A74E684|nr:Rieske (2Fe-2S) protein [Patulibacter sp. DM4]
MSRHVVGTVADVPEGGCRIVEVAGRSIGIYRIGDEFFGLRNRCPHQGGPLCAGKRFGALRASQPGDYEYTREGEFARCPWHGWEFDIRTGQSWFDPQRTRVKAYAVEVESVSGPSAGDASTVARVRPGTVGPDGRTAGPYVAETFAVTVDDEDRLVVDLGGGRGR